MVNIGFRGKGFVKGQVRLNTSFSDFRQLITYLGCKIKKLVCSVFSFFGSVIRSPRKADVYVRNIILERRCKSSKGVIESLKAFEIAQGSTSTESSREISTESFRGECEGRVGSHT